jgi:hypothetical protein
MNLRATRIAAVCIAVGASGCWPSCSIGEGVSMGEMGTAQFAWDEGMLGCLFGCDAEEGMAARAVATLMVVNDEDLPMFTVSSSDESVAQFIQDEPGDSYVRVESHSPGSAKIVLSTVTGQVIDRFEIDVRDVGEIRLSDPDLYAERFTLMVGGSRTLYIDLDDARGRELKGIGGVDYTLYGGITEEQVTLVDALADFIVSILVGTVREYVTIEAMAPGLGTISVEAPSGASLDIPAQVVVPDDVTSLDLVLEEEAVVGEEAHVEAIAEMDGERIYSPGCEWTLDPAEGPVTIDSWGRGSVSLEATAPASATVTCTVGELSDSLTVTFR